MMITSLLKLKRNLHCHHRLTRTTQPRTCAVGTTKFDVEKPTCSSVIYNDAMANQTVPMAKMKIRLVVRKMSEIVPTTSSAAIRKDAFRNQSSATAIKTAMMARTRSTVRLRLRRHEIAYTMSSPALTEAVFPLNRSVMAYLIVSMAKMRKTVQILATLMNLPVIMETVRTSTMSVMVFGTAEMVLMNEIALQDAVMTTSLHVMMDPAHTKAINATAVTIVLTAAMNIIATITPI
uniref:(northern house mosquito) hypothetical protein n=1 Tax=Culex pipiens TaxID=7175 RepID=A0A8D8ETN7_CULPI